MRSTHSLFALFVVLAGLIGWALHFTIMYGGASLACMSIRPLPLIFQVGAMGFSIALLAGLAALVARMWRKRPQSRDQSALGAFLAGSTLALAVISIVAIAWMSLPLLMLAECRG